LSLGTRLSCGTVLGRGHRPVVPPVPQVRPAGPPLVPELPGGLLEPVPPLSQRVVNLAADLVRHPDDVVAQLLLELDELALSPIQLGPAGIGELVHLPAAVALGMPDQALLLEPLQPRVDGSG